MLVDQQKYTFINSVEILGAIKRMCQEWWLIGMDGKKESKWSILSHAMMMIMIKSKSFLQKSSLTLLVTGPLAWWAEYSSVVRETGVQSQVESYQRFQKWYLMLPRLTLSIIRIGSRVNWSNLGKWVVSSPTPQCSSYQKGTLWVTLD